MTLEPCREEVLRREMVRYSRWLSRMGCTPGTSGNLSARLDGHRILVTPTGLSKGLVRVPDIVVVDGRGRLLAGTRGVTSEIGMHLEVYKERSDVGAVIHAHPPIATAFACAGRGLEEVLCQEAIMTVGIVPLASYATTGTHEVAASISPFLQEHDAVLLENHGAVAYGATLTDAFMRLETVEHLAHVALVAHQLGTARPLQPEQVEQLRCAKAKYLRGKEQVQKPTVEFARIVQEVVL